MYSRRLVTATVAVFSLAAISIASAQSTRGPVQDTVVDTSRALSFSGERAYGLPGVGMGISDTSRSAGPGGLRNGIGAIGSGPPSTSSHNPVLVEPRSGGGLSIPIGY